MQEKVIHGVHGVVGEVYVDPDSQEQVQYEAEDCLGICWPNVWTGWLQSAAYERTQVTWTRTSHSMCVWKKD